MRVVRAARRRRYPLLGAVILALATAAPVGIAANDDPGRDQAPVTRQKAEPIVLRGTVEAVPATPLTGISSRSVLRWLVKDGALVKEGDVLYQELKPGVANQLDELRTREQTAIQELKSAQQAPPPDFKAEQDAAQRATEARGEAVRRLEAAQAEGAAGIKAAEATLLQLQATGDTDEARAYAVVVQLGKLHQQNRLNELRAGVSEATRLMDNANAALAWKRYEAHRRMVELRRAVAELSSQIRQLELGIAHGRALHDGVVRIKANRVPDGATEKERVVGELQPQRVELVAPVPAGSGVPDLLVGASVRVEGNDHSCEHAELVPETSVVRCLIPANLAVAPGSRGELRLAAGEE